MKCIPMTLSARFVTAAIWVIEIEDVLDASIAVGLHISSNCLNNLSLISILIVV